MKELKNVSYICEGSLTEAENSVLLLIVKYFYKHVSDF
jgi:hypothetical protein